MLKFLRIICIWICCVSCLFGRITLPAVAAVPLEYFEDHEQLSYDLDTEQSKAKYDTRLLSEQLLKEQKSSTSQSYAEQPEEIVDDLQPHERAASCYKSGHKYTHGQKVPRLDPCEVCLCMDGEIFCWWEKCAKKRQKMKLPINSYINQESTTMLKFHKIRMRTTDRPLQREEHDQQQQSPYKVDAAPAFDYVQQMQYKQKFFKIKQKQKQHSKKMLKKKNYQEEQQQPQQHYQPQQQGEYKQDLNVKHQQHVHKHLHEHEHENEHGHEHKPSSSSKILSFPENLPSVLYHDYKTEEHQHHQHQHRQQHLKHQIEQLQQQQQLKKLKQQETRHEQYSVAPAPTTTTIQAAAASAVITAIGTMTKTTTPATLLSSSYLSTGSDNNYDEIETDSDILPEPPTKKPKVTATTITKNIITTEKPTTTEVPIATSLVMTTKNNSSKNSSSSDINNYKAAGVHAKNESDNDSSNNKTHNNNDISENPLKINSAAAAALDTGDSADAATGVFMNNQQETHNRNSNKNIKDTAEEDDDAFHRWLASTETNNNKNESDNNDNNNNSDNQNNGVDNFDTTQNTDLDMPIGIQQQQKQQHETTKTTTNKNNNKIMNFDIHPQQDLHHTHTHTHAHTHTQNDGDVYFRSSYNDYSSEFNGTVVNIDILLTTADEQQQQQQNQKQLLHQHEREQHQQHHEDQIQQESIMLEADPNKIGAIATKNFGSKTNVTAVFTSTTAATVNATSILESTSTLSPDRQCDVMGTLYKIGDVLPQDTGNCLQCICIDGSTSDDTPRVTCSPHNCPPLVLPDLFDATGY